MEKLPFGIRLAFVLVVALGIAACAQTQAAAGPRAWIDFPIDGTSVRVGVPLTVIAHAYAPDGVVDALLSVNGQAYRRSPPGEAQTFAQISMEWRPEQEGDHELSLIAYAKDGKASSPARVRVKVVGAIAQKATPTVTPTGPRPATLISDLAITSVEAVVAGTKGDVPFCNTRVTYRNAGLGPVPRDFTIQFHFDGTPRLANTVAGGLPAGASAEITFVYQFEGTHYVGINLDSTNVVTESDELNNAFAEARMCGAARPISPTLPATPTRTTVPTSTPTRVATSTPTLVTRTPVPSTPTRTPTLVPPATANLRADKTALVRGECTTLRWEVQNATAVYLDGQGVAGTGTRQVCPQQNTPYTLHVEAVRGNLDRTVTINVSAPPDTTPPPVPDPQVPANNLQVACKANQTLAWLPVTDPTGPVNYDVRLERQVGSNWNPVRTWGTLADKQVEAPIQCGYRYRWSVRARDGAGNYSSWSEWSYFTVPLT